MASRVGDFQFQTHQLLLGNHKRSKTLKEPVAKRMTLNDSALSIVSHLREGKSADSHIYARSSGRPMEPQHPVP